MNNLILLFVIVALVIGAGYLLSISWHDFTRHIARVGGKRKRGTKHASDTGAE